MLSGCTKVLLKLFQRNQASKTVELPPELLAQIMAVMPYRDIATISQVNKFFNELTCNSKFYNTWLTLKNAMQKENFDEYFDIVVQLLGNTLPARGQEPTLKVFLQAYQLVSQKEKVSGDIQSINDIWFVNEVTQSTNSAHERFMQLVNLVQFTPCCQNTKLNNYTKIMLGLILPAVLAQSLIIIKTLYSNEDRFIVILPMTILAIATPMLILAASIMLPFLIAKCRMSQSIDRQTQIDSKLHAVLSDNNETTPLLAANGMKGNALVSQLGLYRQDKTDKASSEKTEEKNDSLELVIV